MLILTGATGTIGTHLLRLLSDRGVQLRALSRRPPAHEEMPNIEWQQVDLADQESVAAACRGAHKLFLLTGNTDDMVRLQSTALRAARAAGITHVVKLSALGASDHSRSVIGLWHHNVEQRLRDMGLAWTILRPHHFLQNFLDPRVHDRRTGQVRSASGDGRIPFVDTRDVAAAAAAVLTGDGHDGQVLTLTGPEAVTYRDATQTISQVIGRRLTHVPESPDDAWRRLRAAGMPTWAVGAQLEIARYQREGGPTEATTETVEQLTGRPPRGVEAFARDHRDRLLARGSVRG